MTSFCLLKVSSAGNRAKQERSSRVESGDPRPRRKGVAIEIGSTKRERNCSLKLQVATDEATQRLLYLKHLLIMDVINYYVDSNRQLQL